MSLMKWCVPPLLAATGFSGTLEFKDARQIRHDAAKRPWDLCAALPSGRLKPSPDLVKGAHAHCLAAPGHEYLVYLESSPPVFVKPEGGFAAKATPAFPKP